MAIKKIKLNLYQLKRIVLTLFLVGLAGVIGFRLGWQKHAASLTPTEEKVDLSLFWYVWQCLESRYLDPALIKPKEMVYGAISGMVSALGDPYTAFFPPQENKVNKEDLDGEFGGIGIQLGYKDGVLAVISPLKDTPAFRAGLKAGDLILRLKDEKKDIDRDTEGLSLPEAVKLIRGDKGSKITLTLAREGEEKLLEKEIVRDTITIPSLEEEWLEESGKEIAYIHLLQFSEVMYQQWPDWVEKVVAKKRKDNFAGVILDLRNNPGGFLDGAVFVGSEFLKEGVIVEQEGGGKKQSYWVNRQGELTEIPLVVLVNQGSASAAEILAGALQHYQRATIIGETTFGKGTVQQPEDLPGGSGLHITVARWLLPGGKNIDKEGIIPDIEVKEGGGEEENDLVLEKGKEILLSL